MTQALSRALPLLVIATACLAGPAAAVADPADFTFCGAEDAPNADPMSAADLFVARELPPGLAMSEAVARAERAVTLCGKPDSAGVVQCRYYRTISSDGGDLGEDFWTLRLTPGADGTLGAVSVEYYQVD